jgi:hypothetical protein
MDNFHWIIFSFCMTRSKVFVLDSLYKTTDKTRYQDIIELIKTAWIVSMISTSTSWTKNFMFTMIGQYVLLLILQFLHYNKNLFHNLVFPYVQVMMQPSSTNLFVCYVCEYMHHVTAYANGSKFEEKVHAHTTSYCYCSYSLVLILL